MEKKKIVAFLFLGMIGCSGTERTELGANKSDDAGLNETEDVGIEDLGKQDVGKMLLDEGIDVGKHDAEVAILDEGIDGGEPDVEIIIPEGVGLMSPHDGLETNTPFITVVVVRRSSWNRWSEVGECDVEPMSILINGSADQVVYCSDDGPEEFFGCQWLYAEVPLREGLNLIEAFISEMGSYLPAEGHYDRNRIYRFHQSVIVNYDPNYSTASRDLIYTDSDSCPNLRDNPAGNNVNVSIVDVESGSILGKIKTSVAQGRAEDSAYHKNNAELHLSSDGMTLYFVGRDGIHYIDTASNQIIETFNFDFYHQGSSWLYGNKIFLLGVGLGGEWKDRRYYVFDVETRIMEGPISLRIGDCNTLAFHPVEPKIYSTTSIYDAENYEFIKRIEGSYTAWDCYIWVGLHSSGRWGVVLGDSSNQGYLNLFDAQNDIFVRTVVTPNGEDCFYLAFAPVEDIVYTGCLWGEVIAYNYENDEILWQTEKFDTSGPIIVTPDGAIYSGSWDNMSRLVEIDPLDGNILRSLWADYYSDSRVYKPAY